MVKPTHTEAIRRGFVIIGMMGPTAITSRDIHSKLINQEGFDVSLRTVERDLAELPNIFPQYFTVIDRSKPWGYKLPLNAKKNFRYEPSRSCLFAVSF